MQFGGDVELMKIVNDGKLKARNRIYNIEQDMKIIYLWINFEISLLI